MKRKTIIIWIMYLSGVVVSYPVGKMTITNNGARSYTVGDRCIVLFMSSLSWANVLAALVAHSTESDMLKQPAKW